MQCDQPQSVKSTFEVTRRFFKSCREKAAYLLIRLIHGKPACHKLCEELVRGKAGIEIGGPSQIFSDHGQFPLYEVVSALDNCNFTEDSLWGRNSPHQGSYKFSSKKPDGRQKIQEAIDLQGAPSASYDFLLSSHTIEHIANPIKALIEWKRLIKPAGTLVLVIPHKDGTFDHRRPVTPFTHLLHDYQANTGEDDMTHLDEIMQHHDFNRDKGAVNRTVFHQRALKNLQNRGLHHHVFNTRLAAQLIDHAGFNIISIEPIRPMHIVVLARQPETGQNADNSNFFMRIQSTLNHSPYPSDRTSPQA